MYWTNYQTIDEIYEWLHELARTHNNVVTLIEAGKTHEGKMIC